MEPPTMSRKPIPKPNIELNCWCIEMAMQWPVIHIGGINNVGQAFGQMQPSQQIDADVIGRASKIKAWVQS
jgi:hypothetical protein